MITKERKAEIAKLLGKAIIQLDKIENTIDGLQRDLNYYEAKQSIPFELHFKSMLLQAGVNNRVN